MGKTSLDFYELQTVLSQVELILNSRPLSVLFDDDLEQILTPNHLLFGRKLNLVNSSSTHPVKEIDLSRHYKFVECLLEHFWKRWRSEYIPSLREFQKAYHKSNNIIPQVGDIVNIFEDKKPRQKWLLERITELIISKDNFVRAAKIYIGKTKRVIERPLNKLYPVEYNDEFKRKEKSDDNDVDGDIKRPRREAAIIGELKRRYADKS